MKILEKLEDQDFLWTWFGGGPDYSVCTSEYGELVKKALPALIRVARAAHNVYVEFPGGEDQRRELKVLGEALKALHNFNAAEMAALQQEPFPPETRPKGEGLHD